MERILRLPDGSHIRLEGQVLPDQWEVSEWRKNGVLERSARPVIAWREMGNISAPMTYEERAAYIVHEFTGADREARLQELRDEMEERRLRSLRSSARRAKTMCRRVIITEGFDELLTLTYRENQEDRELCKVHFKEWYRRMKRALGGFRFCASFERQERGAMHVHIATHKLPQMATHRGVRIKAWELGTRIWRDIVGANNGLCFVGGRSKFGLPRGRKGGLAKMASYVSKYIMKDFENAPDEKNRYSRSNGTVVGKVEKYRLHCTLRELIEVTFEQGDGDVVISHRVSKWSDGVWLVTEGKKIGPEGPVV